MSARRSTPLDPEDITPEACSPALRLEILGQVPFFAQLPQAEIKSIDARFVERGYTPGQSIYFAGDRAGRLYVVAAGKVRLLRHTDEGRDVLLDVLIPGEFFGSLAADPDQEYQETAQAHTAVCTLSVSSQAFRRLLDQHPSVALRVVDAMAGRLQFAHEMIRRLSAQSVEQRVAYILLYLADKLGRHSDAGLLIDMPLSRDDLGEMVGTTTESASRTISQFQKDGLVTSGRGWIAITDREGLAGRAQPEFGG